MRATINHPELFAAVFESITKSKLHRPVTGISTAVSYTHLTLPTICSV